MKMIACLAAALVAGATLLPLDASASPQTVTRTRTVHADGTRVTQTVTSDRDGPRMRRAAHWTKRCTTSWRHHRKVRVCTRVRARW